ncbi:hypothetical protein HN51_047648 [Arachis hypogaea]|uniref:DUF4378 domain-containing protein n=1 Tax=Arachis hypogaea TaxID=3818 RepID=A0A445AHK7_ARAHY|nr:uncharacterized protein LOC107610961 [Arachis ipaensis]XP_020964988.1 uncharacterized protein LOC107610961 [Arachis ipaensis]XP_020964989.1 uncharacterized protein LOC107610961 [Arachis ipaensis]XP_025633063.1 uncharacterized protein LOC112727510 [Arachis hypogaea]XP_025633064.1 uncharacterized protein LOC112727510 [Arachis hypogaea]QHO24015.1 hypothetical protein DS421_12g368630 [Arachis hypogaea]QHO24016.1 hypothetical protein DS421_12g368630 [Arachis hypogaea]RYR25916.1 hypothetical pr
MGKHIGEKESELSSASSSHQQNHPGRVWGIFHVMKYHHWRHVKRKHSHKKHDDGRHEARDEIPVTSHEMPEHHGSSTRPSNVEQQKLKSSPRSKHSIKSRLKALVQEDIYRKKGQHKRSSTCPSKSQLTRADSMHHMDVDPLNEELLTSKNPKANGDVTSNEKCLDCGTVFSADTLEMSKIHKHKRHDIDSSSPNQGVRNEKLKSMNAKILTADASPHLFKDFLDALDLMSKNKDSVLKYIQEPEGSPSIPSPVHNKQDLRSKSKRSNSVSFPLPDSSSGSKDSNKPRQHKIENSPQRSPEVASNVRIKRNFLDLKNKIMQIIEERKKEKHRIAMDAIVDKIPQGNKPSKISKKYTHDPLKDATIDIEGKESMTKSYSNRLSSFSFNKRPQSTMRTESLKESAGRYSQLYETCFNAEANCPKAAETIKLKAEEKSSVLTTPKTFQRFHSLPNITPYLNQSDDSSLFLSAQNSFRQRDGESILRSLNNVCDSDGEVLLRALDDDAIQESILNALEPKKTLVRSESTSEQDVDASGNLSDSDDASCSELVTGHGVEFPHMPGEANSVFSCDTNFMEDTFDLDKLNILDGELFYDTESDQQEVVGRGDYTQKFQTLSKRFNYKIPCVEVDPGHEAAFNYVRKVLELSGFTGSESLEMWYSENQPVNPSVYEELEGCLLLDPDCSGNIDKGGQCNHLLLFDIVNEGLLEIFGRSYCYYPRSLSSLSHVHPLPVGENVLRKVWALISWNLRSTSEPYPSLDYYVSRDLAKDDGWMNLQFDSECVALELDDLIFDDLLDEIIRT